MYIKEIEIENIRGFVYTSFDLTKQNLIFIGPNNSGKTSILLLLDWFYNKLTSDYLISGNDMPDEWKSILVPARETRNSARRITLKVVIDDGRKRRKYLHENTDKFCKLRLTTRMSSQKVVARLGSPTKAEIFESDLKAIELVKELQNSTSYTYISPFRGHSVDSLSNAAEELFRTAIIDWYEGLGGNASIKRDFRKYANSLNAKVKNVLGPVLFEAMRVIPAGIAPKLNLSSSLTDETLIDYAVALTNVSLSTGRHDESYVSPDGVGSGLRSLIELAIKSKAPRYGRSIVAVEEPEAFLHPIAQRTLAKELSNMNVDQRLISSHSPVFVEESDFHSVVLVRNHDFYPASIKDDVRQEINLALLKKHGAEMLFARSVLLVEGEGDYFFFESLRERMFEKDSEGALLGLHVVPVGGCQQFCPYSLLLEAFSYDDDRPIDWMILADSDAVSEIKTIARTLELKFTNEVKDKIAEIKQAFDSERYTSWIRLAGELNIIFESDNLPIRVALGDLESMILEKVDTGMIDQLKEKLSIDADGTKQDVLKKLGSKSVNGKVRDNPSKGPYLRAYIGRTITADEISAQLRKIIERWVKPLGVSKNKIAEILREL